MDSATQTQGTGWWSGLKPRLLLLNCYYPGGATPKKPGFLWLADSGGVLGFHFSAPYADGTVCSPGGRGTLLWVPLASVTDLLVGSTTEKRSTAGRALAGGIVGLAAKKSFRWTTVEIAQRGVSTVLLKRDSQPYVLEKLRPILDAFEHRETAEGTPGEAPPNDTTALIADELEKLASLRDRGILTSEEFDERKAKLLAR